MRFRPCIDIHNGKVKQIVGSTLSDEGNCAKDNFVSEKSGAEYAELYKEHNLPGGHIILLNPPTSEYYEATVEQALSALSAFPGGMQLGGGITPYNAERFLDAGASHVIVTSYVFKDGLVHEDRLKEITEAVGKDRLVLDLSCKCIDGEYFICTDRWQKVTDVKLNEATLRYFASYCDEFLIHAVDVEGKRGGIDQNLCGILSDFTDIPVTYAGGIGNLSDIHLLNLYTKGKVDFTVGSALDIFGGNLKMQEIEKLLIEIQ